MEKTLAYYMGLPYSRIVQFIKDEDGDYFFSHILELDGCHSTGKTEEEALSNLQEAFEGYIEVKLQYKDPIPEPIVLEGYSGKFLLRLPKSLHQRLAREAQKEGVSLNQYATYKLSL